MTTSVKLRTNGAYVAELRAKSDNSVLGTNGPGENVESDWINVPHEGFEVTERPATEEEVAAAQVQSDAANSGAEQAQE